ncbi:MAG: hypothetical protein A2629_01655 [Candidatus Levybacteria bacterium RIFCSPHIGHO2_01_FULL_41_15]|nr:MAG: hypothetical protein A2629_01655 [Candidatus Levybacteria bacterium RIFCSPHIGHO2_01_FULL_41_15]
MGFIGILLLALAAQRAQAHPRQLEEQPQRLAEEEPPAAALVRPDTTGCLIMAGGACPMVQVAAVEVPHQPRLLQPLLQLPSQHLLQQLPSQHLLHKIQHFQYFSLQLEG